MHIHRQRRLISAALVSLVLLIIPSLGTAAGATGQRALLASSNAHLAPAPPAALFPLGEAPGTTAEIARRLAREAAARRRVLAARQLAAVRYLGGADWVAVARCESGMRWWLNVGSFDGGLQFLPSTWDRAGGRRFARVAGHAGAADPGGGPPAGGVRTVP